jgi:hypothetical protein
MTVVLCVELNTIIFWKSQKSLDYIYNIDVCVKQAAGRLMHSKNKTTPVYILMAMHHLM